MEIPHELQALALRWTELKRWERRELGQPLRRFGMSYGQIQSIIPVAKGTLSGWCHEIELTPDQIQRIKNQNGEAEVRYAKLGELLHRRNEVRVEAIRRAARLEAQQLVTDPEWVAGVVAYWAEGAKRNREMVFANSDVAMVKLFMTWSMKYLGIQPDQLTIRLHFHAGQDEYELRRLWSEQLGIDPGQFRKGFVKPEGTGHRKNVLYGGTAMVRVCKSSDLLQKVLEWIDVFQMTYEHRLDSRRGPLAQSGRADPS